MIKSKLLFLSILLSFWLLILPIGLGTKVFITLSILFLMIMLVLSKYDNYILKLFIIINFISHGIGGLLFYLNKENLNYDGWNAIKNFSFSIEEYINIYSHFFFYIGLICIPTIVYGKKYNRRPVTKVAKHRGGRSHKYYAFGVIIFALFISIIMLNYKIAIIGIENNPLPFKLNGLLFYLRNYILPLIFSYHYFRAKKSFLLNITVILCSILIGIASISKGVTFFYLLPLILSQLLTGKFRRLIYIGIITIISYISTSTARYIVFDNPEIRYTVLLSEYYEKTTEISQTIEVEEIINIISTLSNRIYGLQDIILSSQTAPSFSALESTILLIQGKDIVENMAFELFGLKFERGKAFGVNIGILGKLRLIGNLSLVLVSILCLYLGLLLYYMDRLFKKILLTIKNINLQNGLRTLGSLLIVFNFQEGSLKIVYFLILLMFLSHKILSRNVIN